MFPTPQPVKAVLAYRRITNRACAKAVGVNETTFSRVLNGHETPWPALRRRMAEFLGLPEEDLFNGPERCETPRLVRISSEP